jgi:signal transduction histidine kinase
LGCHILAPLIGRAGLRGILYLSARKDGRPFSAADLEFLSLVLDHVSVTLDNALLYESERTTATELLETRARLARSEKMAALGNLSATVAHEVNNPLGIIKNYLQLLRPAVADDPDTSEKLGLIGREVERLTHFVRQLLGALHPNTGAVQPVDCIKLLRDLAHFVTPEAAQHRVQVTCDLQAGMPSVTADATALRQVFLNLILNALDVMPEGGDLTITASVHDDHLEMQVTDNGPGIDPTVADTLFQPFITTKTVGSGTGLGLTVCQTLIEGFGGTITAENRPSPETGAVFRVCLPLVTSDDAACTTGQKAGEAGA